MTSVIDVSGVQYRWPGRQGFRLAIDGFRLEQGSCTLLIGPSGSGKSTLLALLGGITVPERGKVEILGIDIAKLSASARDAFRAEHIGVVFQMFNLLPYGSVVANVILPLSFAPKRRARRFFFEAEAIRVVVEAPRRHLPGEER